MFQFNHYVPILKGKDGEFGAVKTLAKGTKSKLTPLFDVPRVPLDFPGNTPKLPLEDHLAKVVKKIKKSWGKKDKFFIDLFDINLSARISSGEHYLKVLSRYLQDEDCKAILTTGLDRDDDYNEQLAKIISRKSNDDVCIRLQDEDLDIVEDCLDELDELLAKLSISHENTHLLLDFREIKIEAVRQIINKVALLINTDPNILSWKTLTVAGTGYPESLSKIKANTVELIPRIEFILWDHLFKNASQLKRLPTFGDYGAVNPNIPVLDPRTMNPSAKIRYTLEKNWLLLKGHILKKEPKYKQFHLLSNELVGRAEYLGEQFSWGDQYIMDCANHDASCGNLTTWVKVDTNHHLTFVAKQIANYT